LVVAEEVAAAGAVVDVVVVASAETEEFDE